MTTNPNEIEAAELNRSVAQFFFEVGFGACYAEAAVQNGMKPPFALTDALVERAWRIAHEAHEDPDEFERYLALSAASARGVADGWEREAARQEELAKVYRRAQLTAEEKLCREQANAEGWKKRAGYLEQKLSSLSAAPSSPTATPEVEREDLRNAAQVGLTFACMVLAFIGRDQGTSRIDKTLDGLCAEAVKVERQLRAALRTPPAPAGEDGERF